MDWPDLEQLSSSCLSRMMRSGAAKMRSRSWCPETITKRVSCTNTKTSGIDRLEVTSGQEPWQEHVILFACSMCKMKFGTYLAD